MINAFISKYCGDKTTNLARENTTKYNYLPFIFHAMNKHVKLTMTIVKCHDPQPTVDAQ